MISDMLSLSIGVQNWTYILVGISFAIYIGIAIWSKAGSTKDFYVAGGGVHPMLAEFWLRHEQKLDNALESFKGALRQERENPRWLLRIAQVYLAKGWRKDAADQLQRLMKVAELPEQIREEARRLADRLQNS